MIDARIVGCRPQITCAGGMLEGFSHEMADDGRMIVKIGNARIDVRLVGTGEGCFRLVAAGAGHGETGVEIISIRAAVECGGVCQLVACPVG